MVWLIKVYDCVILYKFYAAAVFPHVPSLHMEYYCTS